MNEFSENTFPFESETQFVAVVDLDAANEDLYTEISQCEDDLYQLGGSHFSESRDSESWLNYLPHMGSFADY